MKILQNMLVIILLVFEVLLVWDTISAEQYKKTKGYQLALWAAEGKETVTAAEVFGTDWATLCLAYGFAYQYGNDELLWLSQILGVPEKEIGLPLSFYDELGGDLTVLLSTPQGLQQDNSFRSTWKMQETSEIVCTKNKQAIIRRQNDIWHPEFDYSFNIYSHNQIAP